jgi:hypothetical protein
MTKAFNNRAEIEQIVMLERLHLYNRGVPCGAQATRNLLEQEGVRPLPSVSTIKRILSRNCLTYGRTGYYPEDENGKWKSEDSCTKDGYQSLPQSHAPHQEVVLGLYRGKNS